jgi:hypothetical protein
LIVIADASPLDYLVLIGEVDVLDRLARTTFRMSPKLLGELIERQRRRRGES